MAAYPQSVAYTRVFYAYLASDHVSPATGKTITMNLSKAGAAFAAAGGTITEIANGAYKIVLTTTDSNTQGDLVYYGTAAGTDDIKFVDQVTDPAKGLGSPSNLDAAITSRMATFTYTAPDNATISLIAGYTDSIESRLPAALVGGRMDSSVGSNLDKTGYTAALSAADAAKLAALWQIHGLDLSNDLAVSATSRAVGTIAQIITTALGTTTVHRTA